jgi:structural maintenance of chromosome 3 (chondroitin sulfate proteoglycan 6)
LLAYIEDRLNELEEEKAELNEYQSQDKERRCLEYTLHQRELEELLGALDKIEQDHQDDLHIGNQKRAEFYKREEVVQVSPK